MPEFITIGLSRLPSHNFLYYMTDQSKIISKIILFCFAAQISLAGTTGKLVGRVTSKVTGEPLIGANVILEGIGMGTATDIEGRYVILQIPPKKYDIRYTMIEIGRAHV